MSPSRSTGTAKYHSGNESLLTNLCLEALSTKDMPTSNKVSVPNSISPLRSEPFDYFVPATAVVSVARVIQDRSIGLGVSF